MTYPIVSADSYKKGLGLTASEYATYELIRKTTTLKALRGLNSPPGIDVILNKLGERSLLRERKNEEGDSFLWSIEPVDLLEQGYFTGISRPLRFLDFSTSYQHVECFQNSSFVYFKLNKVIQYHSAEYPACSYIRTVMPAIMRGNAGRVLILGGGDGLVARELLLHKPSQITIVEMDREIPSLFVENERLSHLCGGSLQHPLVKLVIEDALHFIEDMDCEYDLIYSDLDLHATRQPLIDLGSRYLALLSQCARFLSEDGIFVLLTPLDYEEALFIDSQVVPQISRYGRVGGEISKLQVEEKHYLLLKQFFNSVSRIQLKMFFSDAHMIYYCSHRELDERKIRALLATLSLRPRTRLLSEKS